MAKGKQTPRQKMINLMYLVFIAMLAMQIDQEIIRSFQDTNQSLTDSRTLAEKKNDIFELTLKQKADNSPETFGLASQQYQGMKKNADDLVGFIVEPSYFIDLAFANTFREPSVIPQSPSAVIGDVITPTFSTV